MKKYRIAIEETIVKEYEVEAKTAEEAIQTAKRNYDEGVFVSEPGEVQFVQMAVLSPESEATQWREH